MTASATPGQESWPAGEGRDAGGGPAEDAVRQRGGRGRLDIATSDLAFGEGEALRVEDVMRILHLSRNTVYKMAREGALPSYRVGRQVRFRYEDVRAQLEGMARAQETSSQPPVAGVPAAAPVPAGDLDAALGSDPEGALPPWAQGSLIVGGQDLAADVLANYLSGLGVSLLRSHANAYLSLSRMYLGTCHAATVDLWSEADRSYNTPYVRRFLPGVSAVAFRLYKRRVGFTVAARNPLGLTDWHDLLGDGVRVANRERGAGARVLLDEKLKYLEARADRIAGYDRPVTSELAQALLVARGMANVAVTTQKPVRQVKGLEFVPLQDETVDLVVVKTLQTAPFIKAARSLLRTDAFRGEFDSELCDTKLMGEVVYEC